ncbi:acyltransferase family protein [Paraburkholderia graminis]|uniref:Peptidoglycan/LPS O-acetylase OafA/YrhL n=1 Tax=Paraburkholderia graminis TaxID=60548 RepID=A0ABD5CT69_9BURK|nr:acyltransferase family protein [Paraburkholderia graminis]MDR6207800.1 peptidoglycan/LPS O-acetylase OafA/YrhL [Paraburkholderia graminis]
MSTNGTQKHAMSYRPDIDGIRAIAVLSVVVFHTFPSLLPGGFVGVDIFFVISGFLITKIMLIEIENGTHSISGFYARRIRRIFPALITVLILVLIAGWLVLFDDEYRRLAKDTVAGAAFVANLMFWNETGYFSPAAITKPLLHLWSLGVEEQFYIVWPLVLACIHSKQKTLSRVAILVAASSFFVNVLTAQDFPNAAFYSPLSRFWELMSGCFLATSFRKFQVAAQPVRSIISVTGAALILAAALGAFGTYPFPGIIAAAPVIGAFMLLGAGQDSIFNRTILSNPILVWFGKISYPLYLWHWPILSFATILAARTPSVGIRVVLVLTSIAAAWFTYARIERKIRFGRSRIVSIAAPCAVLIAIAGFGSVVQGMDTHVFGGSFSATVNPASAKYGAGHDLAKQGCGVSEPDAKLFGCAEDSREMPTLVMWGDSKAEALFWGAVRESKSGNRWRLMSHNSCAPMSGVSQSKPFRWLKVQFADDECLESNNVALRTIAADKSIKAVALVAAARILTLPYSKVGDDHQAPDGAVNGLDAAINALEHAGKKVVFVIDNPTLPDPVQCMDRRFAFTSKGNAVASFLRWGASDACTLSYEDHLKHTKKYRKIVDRLRLLHPEVLFFDPTWILCDKATATCPVQRNGQFLYSYGDHVSDLSNGLIAKALLPSIEGVPAAH